MEIFKKPEQFVPRQFPEKILKPMPKPKGGGKWIFALFAGSIILSLSLWVYGSLKTGTGFQKIISPQILPTPSPTPVLKKTTEVTLKISDLTKNLKGNYGVYVYNLTTKQSYGILENEVFPAASLIKLPVFLTLYQEAEAGRIDLETKYTLKNSDKQPGAGGMQYKPAGTVYTYRQMAELMGKQSDNTAFYVLRRILGDEKIQKIINDLGMTKTSLAKNETSPSDLGLFFRKLYGGLVVSREHRDEILGYLTETFDETRIPVGVPDGIRVAHKVGTEIGIISDAGIVFSQKPFILVIMSKEVLEKEAKEVLPKITKEVWEFETN
ncbi:MAG: serine hydrolase [Patescibacteria group bacterium]